MTIDFSKNRRLKEFLNKQGVTPYELAINKLGYERVDRVYNIVNEKNGLSDKMLDEILSVCPELNKIWLLTGVGEMLHNPETVKLFPEGVQFTEGDDVNPSSFTGSLVYNIDGTCGPSNRDFEFTTEYVIGSINLPGFDPKMPIVEAVEDSMIPRINPHDLVGLQEVVNWDVIFWGKPYFVITRDYRMFKILNKCKDDQEYVILHSVNSDFEDIQMKKSEILKLFIVKKVLSLRTEVM